MTPTNEQIAETLEALHADYRRDGPQSVSHTRLDKAYRNHHAEIIAALRDVGRMRADITVLRGPLDEALAECGHSSDCATNNMPAMPNGLCNCWRSKFAALTATGRE